MATVTKKKTKNQQSMATTEHMNCKLLAGGIAEKMLLMPITERNTGGKLKILKTEVEVLVNSEGTWIMEAEEDLVTRWCQIILMTILTIIIMIIIAGGDANAEARDPVDRPEVLIEAQGGVGEEARTMAIIIIIIITKEKML